MPKTYQEIESDIQEAIRAIQNRDFPSIASTARHFNVPYSRLRKRLAGRKPKTQRIKTNLRLTADQDAGLCQYLDRLDELGLSARPRHVEAAANLILQSAARGKSGSPPPAIGHNWIGRWMRAHPEYLKRRQKPLQLDRQLAHEPEAIEAWFLCLRRLLDEFGIPPGDIYNYDESGFMIGYARSQWILTKITNRQAYLACSQNRELVTVGETISGDGDGLPPLVILAG